MREIESTQVISELKYELTLIAKRELEASSILMKGLQKIGSVVEPATATVLGVAPQSIANSINEIIEKIYHAGELTDRVDTIKNASTAWGKVTAVASGAVGGFLGMATSAVEIPITTAIIFDTIKKVARQYGFDTADDYVKRECLAVFASKDKAPFFLTENENHAPSFVTTRMLVNGQTVSKLIAKVSAEFSTRLMLKLGAQAVPVMGALTGASINYAFIHWYEEMAHIHFSLLNLSKAQDGINIAELYSGVFAELSQIKNIKQE